MSRRHALTRRLPAANGRRMARSGARRPAGIAKALRALGPDLARRIFFGRQLAAHAMEKLVEHLLELIDPASIEMRQNALHIGMARVEHLAHPRLAFGRERHLNHPPI